MPRGESERSRGIVEPAGAEAIGQARWRELVGEIAELEELLSDLRDETDALALINRHRLQAALEAKRSVLKSSDVGGLLA